MRVGASVLLYQRTIFACKRMSSEEKAIMSGHGKRQRTGGSGLESAELESAAASGSVRAPNLYFVNTKRTYRTADELYTAVCKARRVGKAGWWQQVTVCKDAGAVKLICKQCGSGISARNPADSCGKHFENKDGAHVCKKVMDMQNTLNANKSGSVRGPSCWCITKTQ